MSRQRLVVYSANFCGRDPVWEPLYAPVGIDFIYFTDKEQVPGSHWRFVPPVKVFDCPSRTARYHKICFDHVVGSYDASIWVDASIRVGHHDVRDLLDVGAVFRAFEHRWRNCLYEEAACCASTLRAPEAQLAQQVARYRREGVPGHLGLYETGVLIRTHVRKVRRLCRYWWDHVSTLSLRDQISLPVVLRQSSLVCSSIPGTISGNPWFTLFPHPYLPHPQYEEGFRRANPDHPSITHLDARARLTEKWQARSLSSAQVAAERRSSFNFLRG